MRAGSTPGSRSSMRGLTPAAARSRCRITVCCVSPRTRRWLTGSRVLPAFRPTSSPPTTRAPCVTSGGRTSARSRRCCSRIASVCRRSRWADRRSELGYMLDHSGRFAGRSAYRSGAAFAPHAADFDFNLLPLRDDHLAPSPVQDLRVQPTAQRRQAIFDWWERTFDYTRVRGDVERESDRRLWLLFDEAEEKHPADPAHLLRHMGADARHWPLDLHYFQDQSAPIYSVSYDDLEDDRWVVRAWHADERIQRLLRHLCARDIRAAR